MQVTHTKLCAPLGENGAWRCVGTMTLDACSARLVWTRGQRSSERLQGQKGDGNRQTQRQGWRGQSLERQRLLCWRVRLLRQVRHTRADGKTRARNQSGRAAAQSDQAMEVTSQVRAELLADGQGEGCLLDLRRLLRRRELHRPFRQHGLLAKVS